MRLVRKTADLVGFFVFGAMLGYIWEVLLMLVTSGRLVNRGYLHGPWLPIYGAGVLLLLLLRKLTGKRRMLFFLSAVFVCGGLEYFVGYMSERLYRIRWWSYDSMPLNLDGRIFAGGLLTFAALGSLVIFEILPYLQKIRSRIPDTVSYIIICAAFALMITDLGVSVNFPNTGDGISSLVTTLSVSV